MKKKGMKRKNTISKIKIIDIQKGALEKHAKYSMETNKWIFFSFS